MYIAFMSHQTSIKLSEIDDNLKLWRGTKIRLVLAEPYGKDEYWDYMLVYVPDDSGYMLLVNVTPGSPKAGAVFRSKVKIDHSKEEAVVKKADLKKAFGEDFEDCYLIAWDE
jgi:hypothetical protein